MNVDTDNIRIANDGRNLHVLMGHGSSCRHVASFIRTRDKESIHITFKSKSKKYNLKLHPPFKSLRMTTAGLIGLLNIQVTNLSIVFGEIAPLIH